MPDDKVPDPTPKAEETPKMTVEELAAQLEQIKKAQAGSDKAYAEAAKKAAELAAENEKLKKEKMSEKEKAEYELKQKEEMLAAKEREVAVATLRFTKTQKLAEAGIPLEFMDFVPGNNDEEITNSLTKLKGYVDKLVGDRVNQTLVGTEKPKAGASAESALDYTNLSLKELEQLAFKGELKPRRI